MDIEALIGNPKVRLTLSSLLTIAVGGHRRRNICFEVPFVTAVSDQERRRSCANEYPKKIRLTRPRTATVFPLRLCLHYKAARVGGVRAQDEIRCSGR